MDPSNYADDSNISIVYASPSPVFPLSRNRNTFIERYGWDNTSEVTMWWTRTDLNFKGRSCTSAKELFLFQSWDEEARSAWETKLGLSRSPTRQWLPIFDLQTRPDRLSSLFLGFLSRRTFSFVQTGSSSIWTRSDYPNIIILWILKLQPTRSRSLEIIVLRRLFLEALDKV